MWNSGKKIRTLRDKKNKYSNSCVVRKKKFWTKQKTITPPPPSLQVKWSVPNISRKICYQKISELCSNFNNMSDKSKFYYLFTNEDLSIINIFGKCIIECLETRKLKQGLRYWNIFSLSVYIINFFFKALNLTRNIVHFVFIYIYIFFYIYMYNYLQWQ